MVETERHSLCEWTYEGNLRVKRGAKRGKEGQGMFDVASRPVGKTCSARYSGERMTVRKICAVWVARKA